MATVKAPNTNFTGTTASTPFAEGVAYNVHNSHLLDWFEQNGYEVVYEDGDEVDDAEDIKGLDDTVDGETGTTTKSKSKRTSKSAKGKSK